MMLFQNNKLTVRELEIEDNYLLAKWLSDPAVLQFYGCSVSTRCGGPFCFPRGTLFS